MKNQYEQPFINFTRSEKSGILLLLTIIFVLYVLPDYLTKPQDYSEEIEKFEQGIARLAKDSNTSSHKHLSFDLTHEKSFKLKPFNPNTVKIDELKEYGLPGRFIKTFEKFRNAGAKFYKKEDLKRVYGLSHENYLKLVPYLVLDQPDNISIKIAKENNSLKYPIYPLELNSCDSNDLIAIKGIGPFYCSKIIRYKKALGGFMNLEQLYEIRGLRRENIDSIIQYLKIDPKKVVTISINSANVELLSAHPYLSSKDAHAIINYRRQHGLFKNAEDLKNIISLSEGTFTKIIPYLNFD